MIKAKFMRVAAVVGMMAAPAFLSGAQAAALFNLAIEAGGFSISVDLDREPTPEAAYTNAWQIRGLEGTFNGAPTTFGVFRFHAAEAGGGVDLYRANNRVIVELFGGESLYTGSPQAPVMKTGTFWYTAYGTPYRVTLTDLTPPAVPEPATWAMMIAGFGAVGAAMRRRAKVRVTFA